ncbi:hypothetical protein ACFVYE_35565 [Streptomyces sp. NPDC058239]|uniref:hypothetical protein n=1 Tax=Streptomyces sp. NPDC058239 TaxID=3346395 RepID=UPI0036EB782F
MAGRDSRPESPLSSAAEHALYVAAEKDTLRQQLTGWLGHAGIPVLVVRGFCSQSYADVVHDQVTADPREGMVPRVARRVAWSAARGPVPST